MDCRISLMGILCVGLAMTGCTTTDQPVLRGAAPSPPPPPNTTPPPNLPQTTVPHPSKTMTEADKTRAKVHIYMAQAECQVKSARGAKTDEERAAMWDRARLTFQQILDMDPKHLQALQGLTETYLKIGDKDRALATINKALALAPRDPNLLYDQATVLACRREWKEAENALFNALQSSPENRQFKKQLGMILAREGQFEQGFSFLSQYGGPAYAHYIIARMLLGTFGQEDACKQQLRQTLEANPEHRQARELLERLENPRSGAAAQAPHSNPLGNGFFIND